MGRLHRLPLAVELLLLARGVLGLVAQPGTQLLHLLLPLGQLVAHAVRRRARGRDREPLLAARAARLQLAQRLVQLLHLVRGEGQG